MSPKGRPAWLQQILRMMPLLAALLLGIVTVSYTFIISRDVISQREHAQLALRTESTLNRLLALEWQGLERPSAANERQRQQTLGRLNRQLDDLLVDDMSMRRTIASQLEESERLLDEQKQFARRSDERVLIEQYDSSSRVLLDNLSMIVASTEDQVRSVELGTRNQILGAFAAALCVIWLALWYYTRTDRFYRAREEERLGLERFQALVQQSSDATLILEEDLTMRFASPAAQRMIAYDDTLEGTALTEHVAPDDQEALRSAFARLDGDGAERLDLHLAGPDGFFLVEATLTDQRADQLIGGVLVTLHDISERKQLERQLQYEATHDPLTSLANRSLLAQRASEALARGTEDVALIFVDLDSFKALNDRLGHMAGDEVLREVGRRLRDIDSETLVARFGGDEFAVLCSRERLPGTRDAIIAALQEPIAVSGADVICEPRLGIALAQADSTLESLLREADVAMYVAKQQRLSYTVYDAETDPHVGEQAQLAQELLRVADSEQIEVVYQPQVELSSGWVLGVEALVRWRHPERGYMNPGDFLAVAEAHPAIMQALTLNVLRQATAQANAWERDGFALRLSINVTATQLHDPAFAAAVAQELQRSGWPAEMLTIEVTETALGGEQQRTAQIVKRFTELGITVAIDDFGTGHSSLARLKMLQVGELKIDRHFVTDMVADNEDAAIVRATIGLGHELGLRVVAEGLEDEQTLIQLRALGCDIGQGFHIARPLAAEQLLDWIRGWQQHRREAANERMHLANRKDPQLAMAQTSETFPEMFAHSTQGLALRMLDGRYLRVNERLCEMLGYREAELLTLSHTDLCHPDDTDENAIEQLVFGREAMSARRQRQRRADGSYSDLLVETTVIRDERGQPLHLFVAFIDDSMK